jgi:hypothetical protein
MRFHGPTGVEFGMVTLIVGVSLVVGGFMLLHVRAKMSDSRRVENVTELQKALALYSLSNKHFPIATTSLPITGSDFVSRALLAEGELSAPLVDPRGKPPLYTTNTLGTDYTIRFCLDTDTVPNRAKGCDNVVTP